jgi:hypothetical protein
MASTEITTTEPGGFVALNHDIAEVRGFIEENLAGQDVSEFDLTRLSVPSGKAQKYRWEIPTLEGSEAVDEIKGIIVFQKQTRAFWPQTIDEGGGNVPPSCSSPDARFGFGKQWATAEDPDPDGEPRRLACAQCPQAQFGSDRQGRGQACKQTTQLFLLMETGFLPAVVQVPPTSLGAVKKYMLALANAGVRFDQVVTVFGLDKRANQGGTEYAQVAPRLGGRLDPQTAERARSYGETLRPQFEAAAAAPLQTPPAPGDGPPTTSNGTEAQTGAEA